MPVTEETLAVHSSPIHVPPTLPFILKQYAKAAIRTQPYDLLRWSATYFRALANGEVPPSKVRLEYDIYNTPSGLTPGYLKLLVKQFGTGGTVPTSDLYDKWTGVCLDGNCLMEMLKIGGFEDVVHWQHFLAIAAGHLTDSLPETMNLLCHLLTAEPAGGAPTVPCETFTDLYAYLARLDCGPAEDEQQVETETLPEGEENDAERDVEGSEGGPQDEGSATQPGVARPNPHVPGVGPAIPEVQIQATVAYLRYWSARQRGFVMPRNMDDYLFPGTLAADPEESCRRAAQAAN